MAQKGGKGGRTNGQKISPFYRTSSPIGAAALPPPMKTKEKVEQGKGTADHLMPLGYLLELLCARIIAPPDSTRLVSVSNAFACGASISDCLTAGDWLGPRTFFHHYLHPSASL